METTTSIAGPHYPGQAYNIAAPADEVIGHSLPPAGDDLITGKIAAPRAAPHRTGLQPLRGCLKPPRWRQAVSARVRLVDEARCVVTGDVCAPHEGDSAKWRSDVRARKAQKRLERRKQKEDLRRRLGVTPEQLPPPPPSRAEVRKERRKLRKEKIEEGLSVKHNLDRTLAESMGWQPQSSLVGSMQRVEISDEDDDDDEENTGVPRLVIKWFGVKTKRTPPPPE